MNNNEGMKPKQHARACVHSIRTLVKDSPTYSNCHLVRDVMHAFLYDLKLFRGSASHQCFFSRVTQDRYYIIGIRKGAD